MLLNSNLIFEILDIDENNFQIGIFESFDDKQDLLNLYESLIVSTDQEFDRVLASNFESFQNPINSQYYIASNSNLISTKLNKTDDTFVEELQQVTSQTDEKEHLSFAIKRSYKTSVKEVVNEPPSQLSILLGFAPPSPIKIVKTVSSKPGRGQKSCKFCNAVIGVRCLMCKFCNSLLT